MNFGKKWSLHGSGLSLVLIWRWFFDGL